MTRWRSILFDLDDTLFDFRVAFRDGMLQTMRSHPLTRRLDADHFYPIFDRYSHSLWSRVASNEMTFADYRRQRLMRTLESIGCAADMDAVDHFNQAFAQNYLDAMSPSEATTQLISRLADHYPLGLITNGPGDLTIEKLKRLGLTSFFAPQRIVVSETVGFSKPDPRIFAEGLTRMGVRADETIFVGDSWETDIVGAIHAGIAAVWLNPTHQEQPTDDTPMAVIQRLQDLEVVLINSDA